MEYYNNRQWPAVVYRVLDTLKCFDNDEKILCKLLETGYMLQSRAATCSGFK